MYRCKECGSRFVEDVGDMTYRSHISAGQWIESIKLNLEGASLEKIAASIGVSEQTAFSMRHKLMHALENDESRLKLSKMVELDEKYVMKSHKGRRIEGVEGRKRGEASSKRGLSNNKVCLLTAVQRGPASFLRSYNMARPSSDEVLNLADHIEEGTFLWTDGLNSYESLAQKLNSTRVCLTDRKQYDKVNHLNTVNSFHSRISAWYGSMRGCASKYINRYSALFNIRWMTKSMEDSEALLHTRSRLATAGADYIKVADLATMDLFAPSNLVWELQLLVS